MPIVPLFAFLAAAVSLVGGFYILAIILLWTGLVPILKEKYPTHFVRWAYATTFEIYSVFATTLLMHFFPDRGPKKGDGRPILLIHGFLHYAKVWFFQKRRLEALGLGPIYTINLGYPFDSIENYAEKVGKKAEAIAKETGREDLILIGHSMGGVIAAWYAIHLAKSNSVKDVITIASPLHGAHLIRFFPGIDARELEWNSPFIQNFLAQMAKERRFRFYHIATETDLFVYPGNSEIIETNDHVLLEDVGHNSLLFSRKITDLIYQRLTRP